MKEILVIAQNYVDANYQDHLDGFKFTISEPKEFDDCFYFDFIIVPIDILQNKELPMIGGAPGIKIDKLTKSVCVISHSELAKLEAQS